MTQSHKLAKDLQPGDRVIVFTLGDRTRGKTVTVLANVGSLQAVKPRTVQMVTLRGEDGRDHHRQFLPHSSVRMAPDA